MTAFLPQFCPYPDCTSRTGDPFLWHREGSYLRQTDGRRVTRFRCRTCSRRFSSQTFRLDFRQQKPHVNPAVLACLVSKVTFRQAARVLRIDRKTVHRRLRTFGPSLHEFHQTILRRARGSGGLFGSFSLDELETYEHNRRLRPLTMPVLIHRPTRFVLHLEVGRLPARGGLSGPDALRKQAQGPRPSESRETVSRCLAVLKEVHDPNELVQFVSDQKRSYRTLLRETFPGRIGSHVQVPSKDVRNVANPLFSINHTPAPLRDPVSRLVRRTWAASKRAAQLVHHARVWVAWRNYIQPLSNRLRRVSSGMMLGLLHRLLTPSDLLRWRWPALSLSDSAFRCYSGLSSPRSTI
jgi:transposase-like protein